MERVYWGQPASEVLAKEFDILQVKRVFVITNRSLSQSKSLNEIVVALGERYAGMFAGVTAHSPRSCVVAGALAARTAGADLLLAVGGGSVIDAAKAMLLCLRHGYTEVAQLEPHAGVRPIDVGHAPPDAAEWTRVVTVPTTLSGAEFSASAGLTDPTRGMKHGFTHPMQMPQAVILDPALTLDTPLAMLKSTGMKAIDHAAERITSANANPYSDEVSELALRLLFEALIALDEQPESLQLRSKLQYGMFMSLCGSASGVAVNVSHALGHVLGAHAGVPHGDTTGLVLPAVLRWNRDASAPAQAMIARALGRDDGDAATAVSALVQRLGLPLRLRDAGVAREDLPEIARKTLHEPLLRNSRKPVTGAADIEAILELAW
ncbi:MAG: iron-containing alcohol dehydrogenase [Janthinobacterium lividum]